MTTAVTPQDLIQQLRQQHPQATARAGSRLDRGIRLFIADMVEPTNEPDIYIVRSESNPLGAYRVDLAAKTCTCPDSGRGNACKHRCAAWLHRETTPRAEPAPASAEIIVTTCPQVAVYYL